MRDVCGNPHAQSHTQNHTPHAHWRTLSASHKHKQTHKHICWQNQKTQQSERPNPLLILCCLCTSSHMHPHTCTHSHPHTHTHAVSLDSSFLTRGFHTICEKIKIKQVERTECQVQVMHDYFCQISLTIRKRTLCISITQTREKKLIFLILVTKVIQITIYT